MRGEQGRVGQARCGRGEGQVPIERRVLYSVTRSPLPRVHKGMSPP
jgi:hypothetical protein